MINAKFLLKSTIFTVASPSTWCTPGSGGRLRRRADVGGGFVCLRRGIRLKQMRAGISSVLFRQLSVADWSAPARPAPKTHLWGHVTLHGCCFFLHLTQMKGALGTGKPPIIVSPPTGSSRCNSLAGNFRKTAISPCSRTGMFLMICLLITYLLGRGMSGHSESNTTPLRVPFFWGCLTVAGLPHRPALRGVREFQSPALRMLGHSGPRLVWGERDLLEGEERGLYQELLTGLAGGYACSAINSYSDPILECLLGIRHFVGSQRSGRQGRG